MFHIFSITSDFADVVRYYNMSNMIHDAGYKALIW